MTAVVVGVLEANANQDNDGHRNYNVNFLVETNTPNDGPAQAGIAAGLFPIGAQYALGNDFDDWAFCLPEVDINPVVKAQPNRYWVVGQKFSTRPIQRRNLRQNPLLDAPIVSGGFQNFRREAVRDAEGKPLVSSSFERYRGAQAEVDDSLHLVSVSNPVASINFPSINGLKHHLNSGVMWGMPAKTVKFSGFRWQIKYWKMESFYYVQHFEFLIREDGWRRDLLDEGTRIVNPNGGDETKIEDFIAFKDKVTGELGRVLLDGMGGPLTDTSNPVYNEFDVYPTGNLFSLGVPAQVGHASP